MAPQTTDSQPQTGKQSRVGKRPIPLPKGVTANVSATEVAIKGPKGELKRPVHPSVHVVADAGSLTVSSKPEAGADGNRLQGLTRALLANAVEGVSEGFKQSLDLYGVGYRAELKGTSLTLGLGLSHQVKYELPKGVTARVEIIDEAGTKRPRLHLESTDKDMLGLTGARIRSFRPPEPYKGKGVRYTGEAVKQKAGKAGGKGAK